MLLKTKGQTKQKGTGFLLARADGKRCKLMVVYKGTPKGKVYCEVSKLSDKNILCITQRNAWCDAIVMTE